MNLFQNISFFLSFNMEIVTLALISIRRFPNVKRYSIHLITHILVYNGVRTITLQRESELFI